MNAGFGAGGLLTTETREIDLGEHEGVRLSGRVDQQVLRIGFGRRRRFRFQVTRERPTGVRAVGPSGTEDHRLPPNPDPWLSALQQIALVAIATALIPRLWRRRPVSPSVSRWAAAGRLHRTGGPHGAD